MAATADQTAVTAELALFSDEAKARVLTQAEWQQLAASLLAQGFLTAEDLERVRPSLFSAGAVPMRTLVKVLVPDIPGAARIDDCFVDATNRLKHLGLLIQEWEEAPKLNNGTVGKKEISKVQTEKLLRLLEQLDARLSESTGALDAWQASFESELGPEHLRCLFWDQIDPAAAEHYSALSFQQQHASQIERRCTKQRVRGIAARPRPAEDGVHRFIGRDIDRGLSMRVLRVPYRGVPWESMVEVLAEVDAVRQLQLSAHVPAFYGHEPCVSDVESVQTPAGAIEHRKPGSQTCESHSLWFFEVLEGPSLAALREASGALSEGSLLFRHWRHQLLEALLHVSAQCTFLLRRELTLSDLSAADGGVRLVLSDLPCGAEFPEEAGPKYS